MRNFDVSSWQGFLTTVFGLALITLIGVGIRVLMMLTLQARQQRMNRQINERLKTLIAAYRTLGGSFTGELTVSPAHMRDLADPDAAPSDRPRRIRDAVEAALADILLLGTEDHVRLAGQAAADMAAGRPIHTADLVISLRDYIREALDLDPVPKSLTIPAQGPTRPQPGGGARGGKGAERGSAGGGGIGGGMGGGGMGGGMGYSDPADPTPDPRITPTA
ncbi:hypothetical protein [Tabrizicola sp. BL-A-41-H6]|uniref:hypothetical protein n=1 Tax=Tabrizicola sp. BL-A-41-H6 TaxID=3421107 RepID=UPI003D67E166